MHYIVGFTLILLFLFVVTLISAETEGDTARGNVAFGGLVFGVLWLVAYWIHNHVAFY